MKTSGANSNLQPPGRVRIDRKHEGAGTICARFSAACERDFVPLAQGDAPPPLIALPGNACVLLQPSARGSLHPGAQAAANPAIGMLGRQLQSFHLRDWR
jgi:hypothetical protein